MFFQKEKDLLFLKEVGERWNTLGGNRGLQEIECSLEKNTTA